MENVLKLLARNDVIPLIAVGSATDAAIYKKIFEIGTRKLIVSNEEMNEIIKIVEPLEKSDLLKVLAKQLKMKHKKKKKNLQYVIK